MSISLKITEVTVNQNKNQEKKPFGIMERSLLSLLYVASCAFIPIILFAGINDWLPGAISFGMAIISVAIFAKISGGFKYTFSYSMILCASFMLGGALPAGLLVTLVSAVCAFSYFALNSSIYLGFSLSVISYALALALTRDPTSALIVFFSLPASILTAYVIKKRKPRVSAICHICSGFCLSLAAVIAVAVYKFVGTLDLTAINTAVDAAKSTSADLLGEFIDFAQNNFDLSFDSVSDMDLIIDNLVTICFNLIPAFAVIIFNLFAYVLHSLMLTLMFSDESQKDDTKTMLTFDMSIHSAFLLIASFILSLVLTSDSTALYGAASENLALILIPGYLVTSFAALKKLFIERSHSCLGVIIYFAIVFAVIRLANPLMFIAALGGAVFKIFVFFKNKIKNKSQA